MDTCWKSKGLDSVTLSCPDEIRFGLIYDQED